jgi:tetratricopeptide (TPR) repeat protein
MANKKAVSKSKTPSIEAKSGLPFHFKGKAFHFLFAGVVIALCFALYGNSIPNNYSLDDEFVMHGDSTVQKGIKGIPTLFKSRYAWDQKGSYGYRPVSKVSFAIEDQFFGLSPHAGHVINIVIYALLVISLFYFLRKILYLQASDYFLFLVVGIFLAHPLHTEVIDSLKNRDSMISFIFGLLYVFTLVKCFEEKNVIKQIIWMLAACISMVIGSLSKQEIVLFMTITPVVLFFLKAKPLKNFIISFVPPLVSIVTAIFVVRHILPPYNYHRTFQYFENPLQGSHWYQRFQLGFASLWFYSHKLVFPKDLVCYYGYNEFPPFPAWTDANVLAGVILTIVILWFLYKMALRIYEKKQAPDIWTLSLLLFTGNIAAFVNVIKVGPGIVAERFMFIPSVGFALLVALLLFKLFKAPLTEEITWAKFRNLFLVSISIFILYSFRTIERNPNWKTHLSVYEHDANEAPRSAKLQSLLASAYVEEIKKNKQLTTEQVASYYEKAEKAFIASVDVYPKYSTSLNNIGMIEYLYYKNMNAAIQYFNKAIASDSNYTDAWFNAGSAYRELKNYDMAEKCFLHAIAIKPQYDMAFIQLSNLYSLQGRYGDVLKLNEGSIVKGYPSDAKYVNMGKVYLINGDTTKAIQYFDTSLAYFSKNQILCNWLASYYSRKGDTVKMQHYLHLIQTAEDFTKEAIKRQ